MSAITIQRDPADPVAVSEPVSWAMQRLLATLHDRGWDARIEERPTREIADTTTTWYLTSIAASQGARSLAAAGVPVPVVPEAFAIVPSPTRSEPALALCGSDVRGLVYAILEMADRAQHASRPADAVPKEALNERPANAVRSVTRLFCSEVEDKPWFYDEAFWDSYLSMLVTQRFNRFSLTLGLGYNYHRDVSDAYLYFAYPFLLSVPGYDVRVPQLPDEERDRNLLTLRSIAERAAARGLEFQVGLWTHAFDWIESPHAEHTIEGLTPDRHAAYCRDAVQLLLEACPKIDGLTFRIHGESGVPEGSWDFWGTVFDGVAASGRNVGLDLHAKGLDERTLRHALDTGLAVTVSPKFWAEHMGLSYHQAAIRERERAPRDDPSRLSEWHRHMSVSEGSRPFTRYGYADFLREDRGYDVVFRLWAGTQRLLLWGDPAAAAGYGRAAQLAGANGLEWCEPLTFKGREGTGVAGSRTGYADPTLIPAHDWEKFAYAYRVFGRLTYDPDAQPECWLRALRGPFGHAALDAEASLAAASRILPLVTTAHHPSASNNYYWPEIYTDMPIVWTDGGTRPHPYLDTPEPRRIGTVSPLDPEVFSSVTDFVSETLSSDPSGRVSPLETASLLEKLADRAERGNAEVRAGCSQNDAEVRRWTIDVEILAQLGRFWAGKLRAATWYEAYALTNDLDALDLALASYRAAREGWSEASRAARVYVDDLTFGPQPRLRGHWIDRLPAIDADLADMEQRGMTAGTPDLRSLVTDRPFEPPRDRTLWVDVAHRPPDSFIPGETIDLTIFVRGENRDALRNVVVRYRPMTQALPMSAEPMVRSGNRFTGSIATRADVPFPLAYAFVFRDDQGGAWRYPGLGDELASQPYFVVRQGSAPGLANPDEAR